MNYYALQVKTRSEEKYIKLFKAVYSEIDIQLYFPQRSLDLRQKGKIVTSNSAIFPGYIFLELKDDDNIIEHQWAFRRTEGFFRFLRSNQDICPLTDKDLDVVLHFIKRVGPIAGKSKVYFNENSRIVVCDGPLMGLEGKIIKVDKRKGRAKIKLDIYENSFAVDLAFELIEPANF